MTTITVNQDLTNAPFHFQLGAEKMEFDQLENLLSDSYLSGERSWTVVAGDVEKTIELSSEFGVFLATNVIEPIETMLLQNVTPLPITQATPHATVYSVEHIENADGRSVYVANTYAQALTPVVAALLNHIVAKDEEETPNLEDTFITCGERTVKVPQFDTESFEVYQVAAQIAKTLKY